MRFNKLGQQAKFDANNFFYSNLPATRQTMFKRAFGLLPEKSPLLRYERTKDGGVVDKNAGKNYQETLIEARGYVTDMLETYALLMGSTVSQVVHAVISGDEKAYSQVVERRIRATIVQETHQVWDTELGATKPKIMHKFGLPEGHRWKGNPLSVDNDVILKAILANWVAVGGLMTSQEQALEGGEEAVAALKKKERDKARKNYNTSRKDSMKGVQVVNARQKARQAVATGA